ncbi:MAG: FxsA family protein [Candidatus Omnitrophota bacterium]
MFGYLVILFTIVPLVELMLLIKVGHMIGLGNTLFIVVFTGILGAYLAKTQGLITLVKIQEDINNGIMPTERLFDGALILVGGVLLLTPGLITDFMGFLLLIPFTRYLIKAFIRQKVQGMISGGKIITIGKDDWRER